MAYDSKGSLNKVMLIGRLGQDPELKYTAGGAAVLTISLATSTSYKDQSGNYQEQTEWHRVVLWRKQAELVAQYAKKGHRMYFEGKLRTRSWDDKNGTKHFTTEVQVDNLQFLESGRAASGPAEAPQPPLPAEENFVPPSEEEADDLPF